MRNFFLRFSDSSKPSQSVLLIYKMAWLAEIRKSDENLPKSCKVAPVTKVQITNVYFGDVTTIENNRQVRVNIDATLVAMFRIAPSILEISAHGYPITQLSPFGPLVFSTELSYVKKTVRFQIYVGGKTHFV